MGESVGRPEKRPSKSQNHRGQPAAPQTPGRTCCSNLLGLLAFSATLRAAARSSYSFLRSSCLALRSCAAHTRHARSSFLNSVHLPLKASRISPCFLRSAVMTSDASFRSAMRRGTSPRASVSVLRRASSSVVMASRLALMAVS